MKCIFFVFFIVILIQKINSLQNLQNKIKIPIINAGDGDGEHPRFSIIRCIYYYKIEGTVNKLVVSIVGDLRYGRTVHSLVRLLSNYNITFNFVSVKELSIDENTLYILENKNIKYNTFNSINDVITTTDVL